MYTTSVQAKITNGQTTPPDVLGRVSRGHHRFQHKKRGLETISRVFVNSKSLQVVTDLYLARDEITPTRCWTVAIVASVSRAPLATSASPAVAARVADGYGATG